MLPASSSPSETRTVTPSRTETGTSSETRSPTKTRSYTRSASPSRSTSVSPSSTPLTCSDNNKPVRVTLLNNIFPVWHDDTDDPVLLPQPLLLAAADGGRRLAGGDPATLELPANARRELQQYAVSPKNYDPQIEAVQYNGDDCNWGHPNPLIDHALDTGFGSIALTDGQRVSLRFSAPCVAPCEFSLSDMTMLLASQPLWFLDSAARASVVFKVELGRYYYKPESSHAERPYWGTSGRRELTYDPGVIVDWDHSGGAVWSDRMIVGNSTRLYNLGLGDLHYAIPVQSPFSGYAPGDFKLMLTPYINYDRRNCDLPAQDVERTPQQIRWMVAGEEGLRSPSTMFSKAGGFDLLPVCPATSNGQVVGPAQNRALTVSNTWFPDVCLGLSSEHWSCSGVWPGLKLNGWLPCGQAYPKLREEEQRIESSASRTPSASPSTDPVVDEVVIGTRLLGGEGGLNARKLNNWPPAQPNPCPVCPLDVQSSDLPFKGADNTAEGRWLSPWYDSLRTQKLNSGATGSSDLLMVFPVPCRRCKVSLRHLWLPLASDHLPRTATANKVCRNLLEFTTTVGFWNGGFDGQLQDGAAFNWASFVPVGQSLITRVELNPGNQTHLPKVATTQLFLGTQNGPADVSISDENFLAVRIRADSCYILGSGLHPYNDDWTGNPHDGACIHDNSPVALFQPTQANNKWSFVSQFTPGLFAPIFEVNTALPPLCSPKPSASASVSPWPTKTRLFSPAPSPSFSATSSRSHGAWLSPSRNPGVNTGGTDTGAGSQDNTDTGAIGGKASGLSGGAIAGAVIGAILGVLLLAGLAVLAVARFRNARQSPSSASAAAGRAASRGTGAGAGASASAARRTPAAPATDASAADAAQSGSGPTPSTMRNRRSAAAGNPSNLATNSP